MLFFGELKSMIIFENQYGLWVCVVAQFVALAILLVTVWLAVCW